MLLFSAIHLKFSPEVEFPASLAIIPPYPKEDTLDIRVLLQLSEFAKRYIDNEHFTFLLRSSPGASRRVSRWKSHPVAPLFFGFGSFRFYTVLYGSEDFASGQLRGFPRA